MSSPEDNPFASPKYVAPSYPPSYPSAVGPAPSLPSDPFSGPPTPLPPVNKFATLALILSALTPVLTMLSGIAGVVLGRRALKEIAQTGERGQGRATTAVWIGAGLALTWVLVVAFIVAMVAGSTSA